MFSRISNFFSTNKRSKLLVELANNNNPDPPPPGPGNANELGDIGSASSPSKSESSNISSFWNVVTEAVDIPHSSLSYEKRRPTKRRLFTSPSPSVAPSSHRAGTSAAAAEQEINVPPSGTAKETVTLNYILNQGSELLLESEDQQSLPLSITDIADIPVILAENLDPGSNVSTHNNESSSSQEEGAAVFTPPQEILQLPENLDISIHNEGPPVTEEAVPPMEGDDVRVLNPATVKKRIDGPRANVRRRTQNPDEWISTKRKVAKNTGQQYVTPKGKLIKAAQMRNGCSCRMRCCQKFPEDARQKIFSSFWAIGDHTRQWDYITRHSTSCTPKKRSNNGNGSRKNATYTYFFYNENKKKTIVCQYMFLATLGINSCWVGSAYKSIKSATDGAYCLRPDARGKHKNRPHKTSEAKTQSVHAHINTYPRIPSHYTRARSKREYLERGLSIKKMYRHYTKANAHIPLKARASERQYSKIYSTQFNLGKFKPKKDQCSKCKVIRSCERAEREQLKQQWIVHLRNKETSRKERYKSKTAATADRSIYHCCFDLQKVMLCPRAETSEFYYSSKLSVYNFSVFNVITDFAICFMWHEMIAGRGANDIASCLFKFIKICVAEGMKVLSSFSDSCSGQNRNRFMFAMMLLAAVLFKIKIMHQFMEPGHTQNENDGVHGRIEAEASDSEIYTFGEWVSLAKSAKINEPFYRVVEMQQNDIYDFKALVELQNWKIAVDGSQVKWSKVRVLEFDGNHPNLVKFKYDYASDFMTLNVNSRRGRPVNLATHQLSNAYERLMPLAAKKVNCLKKLCKDLIIPSRYHGFWKNILLTPQELEELEQENRIVTETEEDGSWADGEEVEDVDPVEVQRNYGGALPPEDPEAASSEDSGDSDGSDSETDSEIDSQTESDSEEDSEED